METAATALPDDEGDGSILAANRRVETELDFVRHAKTGQIAVR